MVGAHGRERKCQEVTASFGAIAVPCGESAVCIVDNGDTHPYWMCAGCADHNVRNRGAVRWEPRKKKVA